MKKIIVGLIVFFAVALAAIIGVLGYTKVFMTPKNVFKKQFGEVLSNNMEYKPAKLKNVYEAMNAGPIEFNINAEVDADELEEESDTEGDTNYHETSLTLSMNDEEEESENDDSSEQNDENEQNGENEETQESDEDEPEESEEDDFISSYTPPLTSGGSNSIGQSDEETEGVPEIMNLNYVVTTDRPNRAANCSMEMIAKDDDKEYVVLKGDVNYSNRILSAFIEGLHDKSIAIENKNLRKMFENFEVSEDTLKYIPDSIEVLEMSDEEVKAFETKVTEFMVKTLDEYDDSAYSVTKFSEQYGKYIDGTYTGKKASLKIPTKSMATKVVSFMKEILEDETTLPSLKKTLTNDAKKEVLKSIDEMQKDADKIDESQMMEISVFVSKDGAYKILVKVDGDINIEFYEALDPNKDKVEAMLKSSLYKDKETSEIITPGMTTYSYCDFGSDNLYQLETIYNQEDLNQMLDDYNNKKTEDESEDSYLSSFDSEREIDYYKKIYPDELSKLEFTFDNQEQYLLSGTIKISGVKNGKKETRYDALKKSTFSVKKSDGKNIRKVTNDNGMIINNYAKEDFEDMKVEVLASIEKYAQENPMSWAAMISPYMSLLSTYSGGDSSGYNVNDDEGDSGNDYLSDDGYSFDEYNDDSSEDDEITSDNQESEESDDEFAEE